LGPWSSSFRINGRPLLSCRFPVSSESCLSAKAVEQTMADSKIIDVIVFFMILPKSFFFTSC
jgi:hypothetical protein